MRNHLLIRYCIIGLLAWVFTGCAPARFVRPLDKGQTAVTANFGGPIIRYGQTVIPMPLTSVAAGHGFTKTLTGFAGLHTTALAFGVLQTDIGILKEVVQQKKWQPGISVAPVANVMFDKWENKFSLFPQLDAHAYWKYFTKPHFFYLGYSNWFDLHSKRNGGEPQQKHWVPIIELGNTLVRNKWSYTVELKYIAPNYSNRDIVVDYTSFGQTGAIGFYLGVTRKF